MMLPSNIPLESSLLWKVASSLVHVVAVSSSVYRLWQRFRIYRAWWDDYILFLPLVLDTFFGISFWFAIPRSREPDSNENVSYALVVLNSYWFTRFMCMVIVWSTRTILALSLARLFPKNSRPRMWSIFLAAIMVSFLVANIFISATTCQRKTILLLADEKTDCVKSIAGAPLEDIFVFACDVISDTLLVLCPIYWFWNIRFAPKERRLIILAFCGNVLTLISVISFILLDNLVVPRDGANRLLLHFGMLHIEAAISLFVCNFTVITTTLYRLVRRRRPSVVVPIAAASRAPAQGASPPRDTYPLTQSHMPETSSERWPTPLTLTEISSFSSARDTGASTDPKPVETSTRSSIHEKSHTAEG